MASKEEFDLTPGIYEILQFHITNLQREIAAENYRDAWRHAWIITAALYYKAKADYTERMLMGGR